MKSLRMLPAILLIAGSAGAQTSTLDLSNNNIFSRERGAAPRQPIPSSASGALASETSSTPRFAGTFTQDQQVIAFIEVQTTNGPIIQQVREGDTIAWNSSRVTAITKDSLLLSSDTASPRVVNIGNNLLNQTPDALLPKVVPAATLRSPPILRNSLAVRRTTAMPSLNIPPAGRRN